MSKKRFLSIVLSAVMILSLACSALAVGQSGRYIGNSTVNGSIYQTYYQVDAQTRTGIKSISVSGTLYMETIQIFVAYAHSTVSVTFSADVALQWKQVGMSINFTPQKKTTIIARGNATFKYNGQGYQTAGTV